jgi:PAS domain S-box-containing protein
MIQLDNTKPKYEILLIDDDEDDYLLIREMFAKIDRGRYNLQWASTDQVAVQLLAAKTWDAVLVDYDLGAANGIQIIRGAVARDRKTPFIVVTGRGSYEKDVEAMEAGAADYLSKIDLSAPLLERTIRYGIERKRIENELDQRVEERTEELQTTIEELQVAEDELRIQLDQLNDNLSGGEHRTAHFQSLFEFAPSGYLVTDTTGKILEMNHLAERLLNGTKTRLIGKPLGVFIVQEDRFEFRRRINQLSHSKHNDEWLSRVQPSDRQPFDGQFIVSPIRDTSGIIIALRWLINDVSQKTQAIRNLESSKEELESRVAIRNAELKEANERLQNEIRERKKANEKLQAYSLQLERVNQDLQNFVFIASHDLSEPLRKIQQFGENLQAVNGSALDENGQDWLKRMLNAAIRMQTMLNDLLIYARITTHTKPFTRVDLHLEAQTVISDLEGLCVRTRGKIVLDDLPTIEADPLQIRHLLQNLIQNAIKFHRPDVPPVVKISAVSPSPDEVQVLIQDNGIGLDEENFETVFQPFRRLHGRSEYEGNGMGLAICQRIVERHSGTITVESSLGSGSTFFITLPIQQRIKDDSFHA